MYLYFTGMGIIFQVNICQRQWVDWSATSHAHAKTVAWPAQMTFSEISNSLLHCNALTIDSDKRE